MPFVSFHYRALSLQFPVPIEQVAGCSTKYKVGGNLKRMSDSSEKEN